MIGCRPGHLIVLVLVLVLVLDPDLGSVLGPEERRAEHEDEDEHEHERRAVRRARGSGGETPFRYQMPCSPPLRRLAMAFTITMRARPTADLNRPAAVPKAKSMCHMRRRT